MVDWKEFVAICKKIAESCFEEGYATQDFKFAFFAPWHSNMPSIAHFTDDSAFCIRLYRDARLVIHANMPKIKKMNQIQFQAWLVSVFVPSLQANIKMKLKKGGVQKRTLH